MRSKIIGLVLGLLVLSLLFLLVTENEPPIPAATPTISYLDILNNPEFETKMKLAVKSDDRELFRTLQSKAIEIGTAANLPAEQMRLIAGQRGRNFLTFRIKRQLFLDEVVRRYNNLENLEGLENEYPEAKDLLPQAEEMIAKRDQLIVQIARSLADDDDYRDYLPAARKQWLKRAQHEKR